MRIVEVKEGAVEGILENLLKRSPNQYTEYEATVKDILANVKEKKDEAVFAYTEQFDHAKINASNVEVTEEEMKEA